MRYMVSTDILCDFRKCIAELLECNAFELQLHTADNGQTDCYIPYMMNDALECYFVLKDCKMLGEYVSGNLDASDEAAFGDFAEYADDGYTDGHPSVELIETDNSPALILRQKDGNVATLWFKDISKELKCYRYHEIGHFWVAGQEHYRQLVYMIGTIYDKFEYMGASICNAEELALLPLMEFAPFRYWSPIHESLDGHYPDSLDGIACFKELCLEAGDKKLYKLACRYERRTGLSGKLFLSRLVSRIANELISSGHEALYELLYHKVCSASSKYPDRNYGETVNQMILDKRLEVTEKLYAKGFIGEYPRFRKENVSVLVTEEHPFTLSVLEYENYGFRMQYMVSEMDFAAESETRFLNAGFFKCVGRKDCHRGRIAKSLEEI